MNFARLAFTLICLILLPACGSNQTTPPPAVSVVLSPTTISVDQGASQQFSATVRGTSNTTVTWSIREGAKGGSIDAQGKYTAPPTAGFFHIVASSVVDSTKEGVAQVSVNQVALSISPATGDMEPGTTTQFTATVTGTVNREVIWSVVESTGGLITSDGLYTAPAISGTFHVLATSAGDSTKAASIAVAVANLAVSISPRVAGIAPGGTRRFSAEVSGCMDDRVTWAMQEGISAGVISGDGAYAAPAELGQYHVLATSVAHPSVSSLATVVVLNSGFSPAGDMTQLRSYHTATRLSDGNVLLVGGDYVGLDGYAHTIATAEIFDPATGTFHATGSMNTARESHTATLLPNGKVLVTGGGEWVSTDSAEIYDPASGRFTPTGNMLNHRTHHTATLLANGKVLIAGGAIGWWEDLPNPPDLRVAELYDPASGTFTITGRMGQSRISPTATMLPDGRVLIVGGKTDWGVLSCTDSAEVFDPATSAFSPVGHFSGNRCAHTATLLANNRVLLVGGELSLSKDASSYQYMDDSQVFDPSTAQFSFFSKLNDGRSSQTATLLNDGEVLLAGGYDATTRRGTSTAEVLDPSLSAFLVTGSMAKGRAGHTATLLLDGRVLVAGGAIDKSAELYSQRH